jgi:hypothetical protein
MPKPPPKAGNLPSYPGFEIQTHNRPKVKRLQPNIRNKLSEGVEKESVP